MLGASPNERDVLHYAHLVDSGARSVVAAIEGVLLSRRWKSCSVQDYWKNSGGKVLSRP